MRHDRRFNRISTRTLWMQKIAITPLEKREFFSALKIREKYTFYIQMEYNVSTAKQYWQE